VWKGETGAAADIKARLADLFQSILAPPSRKAQEREEKSGLQPRSLTGT